MLQRWGDQLSSNKGRSELHNPLSMGEALPLLPLSRPLFAGAQHSVHPKDILRLPLSMLISRCSASFHHSQSPSFSNA